MFSTVPVLSNEGDMELYNRRTWTEVFCLTPTQPKSFIKNDDLLIIQRAQQPGHYSDWVRSIFCSSTCYSHDGHLLGSLGLKATYNPAAKVSRLPAGVGRSRVGDEATLSEPKSSLLLDTGSVEFLSCFIDSHTFSITWSARTCQGTFQWQCSQRVHVTTHLSSRYCSPCLHLCYGRLPRGDSFEKGLSLLKNKSLKTNGLHSVEISLHVLACPVLGSNSDPRILILQELGFSPITEWTVSSQISYVKALIPMWLHLE